MTDDLTKNSSQFTQLGNPRDFCDIWDTDYNSDNWEPEFMTFKSDTGQHLQFLQSLLGLL